MEEKETKKSTPRKPKATTPKKANENVDLQEQMAAMMRMMMQQQQQIMELMASKTQEDVEVEEVKPAKKTTKPVRESKKGKEERMNKQKLRRKYKDQSVYLVNVTQGILVIGGKHEDYSWDDFGESVAMDIEDLIRLDVNILKAPWLVIDEDENDEEMIIDIVEALGLQEQYVYLELLDALEDDINKLDFNLLKEAFAHSQSKTLKEDVAAIIQSKITDGTLTNTSVIKKLEEELNKNFNK